MRADFLFMPCLRDKTRQVETQCSFLKKKKIVFMFYMLLTFILFFLFSPLQSTTTPTQNSRDSSKITSASGHHMAFHILNVQRCKACELHVSVWIKYNGLLMNSTMLFFFCLSERKHMLKRVSILNHSQHSRGSCFEM